LTEVNRFKWPGPDLRPIQIGNDTSVAYGLLSRKFFHQLREKFVAILKSGEARIVGRE
jgi:hypothetical protein